jgi:redox-regulated HSP33 family molecular chaperone
VTGVLATFTAEEIAKSVEDDAISVRCEFCGQDYRFDPGEFAG